MGCLYTSVDCRLGGMFRPLFFETLFCLQATLIPRDNLQCGLPFTHWTDETQKLMTSFRTSLKFLLLLVPTFKFTIIAIDISLGCYGP